MPRQERKFWKLKAVRGFRKNQSGNAAVEFGFVAMPFFALLFAILETSLSFFTGQILETAVSDAARLLRTGQAQKGALSAADFKTKVCAGLPSFFDCQNTIKIDVRTYDSFADADLSRPLKGGNVSWTPQYDPGGPGDIVVVRAIYPMTTYTNFYGASIANTSDGKLLLMASSAFRNEPYQ